MNKIQFYRHLEELVFQNRVPDIELQYWGDIVEVLREINLLAACYYRLRNSEKLKYLPEFAHKHFKAASTYSERQAKQVEYETDVINSIINKQSIIPIFLKGAGYTVRNSKNALGRVYSDIDVLVSKDEIALAENALKANGWRMKALNVYDDKYYREWAHEIPPMYNVHRGTVIDLHHNIVLPISGKKINLSLLVKDTVCCSKKRYVLSPVSTVIHSAVHLIINEDLTNGYRDILDIASLIEEFGNSCFWDELYDKSLQLGFVREVYIALLLSKKIARSNVCERTLSQFCDVLNNSYHQWSAEHIYYWAIQPQSPLVQSLKHKIAVFYVYITGHMKKMPLKVLIPHSAMKLSMYVREKIFGKHHLEP